MALAYGWRGWACGKIVSLLYLASDIGWQGAALGLSPVAISHAVALVVARAIAGREPWLTRERSTLAFLASAFVAPSIPALASPYVRAWLGMTQAAGQPAVFMNWLRESAGILALAPALLVCCRMPWPAGWGDPRQRREPWKLNRHEGLELLLQVAAWTAALWASVHFRQLYDVNIIYLTFLPLLAFTLRHGMRLSAMALAANAMATTALWRAAHWDTIFSAADLRLLISLYSLTVLALATLVEERRRAGALTTGLLRELRSSEEKFSVAFHNAPVYLLITDFEDGRVVEVNEAFLQGTGYTRGEVIGKTTIELKLNHCGRRDRLLNTLRKQGQITNVEFSIPAKNGDTIFCLRGSTAVSIQGRKQILTMLQDITERKIAEKAREEAERHYREIFEGALEGIYRTSPEGRSFAANAALARMLGYSSSEEVVARIVDSARQVWLHPEERQKYSQLLEEQGEVRGFECQFKRKDGSPIWVSVNGRRVSGPDGKTLWYEGFIEDIDERKRAEAEHEKLQSQLAQAQKMESVGRLAGGVAHDFNNLLTVINGYSKLALTKLTPGDVLRTRLEEILKAGQRAAGLTQQLLAFSRKQLLDPRVFDLNGVVGEMRSMLEHMMGDDVEVAIRLYPHAVPVFADAHQLEQVIMNLAVNARHAMPAGGRLSLETSVAAWDEHAAASWQARQGRWALLTVADTGSGMDEATRQRMFEPFFTTKASGTGLGLSMVQGIVAQSGGHIDVDSAPGSGTAFRIYLPLQGGTAAEVTRPAAVPSLMGDETVLVVEDRAEVRDFVADVLKGYGYRVSTAANAEEALTLCEDGTGPVHLVLADVVMPGIGGADLVARLDRLRPGIKALFMSGYSEQVMQGKTQVDDSRFIQKPFSPDQLAEKVRSVLSA